MDEGARVQLDLTEEEAKSLYRVVEFEADYWQGITPGGIRSLNRVARKLKSLLPTPPKDN